MAALGPATIESDQDDEIARSFLELAHDYSSERLGLTSIKQASAG
jgi:hypothetical protein